jgi:hypothetical protein
MTSHPHTVIPAKAGIHNPSRSFMGATLRVWIPAFAGMTKREGALHA